MADEKKQTVQELLTVKKEAYIKAMEYLSQKKTEKQDINDALIIAYQTALEASAEYFSFNTQYQTALLQHATTKTSDDKKTNV